MPVPAPDGAHDLSRPEYFLNRELTWLNFNFRVLHESEDERTPLLERLKFVAIVSNNLDEFFMKRVGGLKQQVGAGMHEPCSRLHRESHFASRLDRVDVFSQP